MVVLVTVEVVVVVVVFVTVLVLVVVTVVVVVVVCVVVHEAVVVPVPVMLSVMIADESWAELPAPLDRVIVMVEGVEKEAPGARLEGIDPYVAVNGPDPENDRVGVERVAGMFPVFLITYEITAWSPGCEWSDVEGHGACGKPGKARQLRVSVRT